MHETHLAPFTANDGENLAMYEWPLDNWVSEMGQDALPPRGVVLIIHGLGEHASRYEHVARRLLEWGFAVRAYDQRGHGESGGARGVLPTDTALLDDLAEVIDDTQVRCLRLPHVIKAGNHGNDRPLPFILMGHSLGGLVAGRFVSLKIRPVEGLVMCSPALDVPLSLWQRMALAVTPGIAPHFCVDNGLDPRHLSRDKRVVQHYQADPLVHRRVSSRLAKFIATAGPATVAAARAWKTPTLLMYAGADRIVNPAGSHDFARHAATSPEVISGTVTTRCFGEHYHELFNESRTTPVFDTLKAWLDARF